MIISIVVPIYNADKYLKRCLDSVKNQTYADYEVILVDDGSMDQSADICREYVDSDDRFKYFYQENSGPDMARKLGTAKATGEYLMYVDADDYISEDMLDKHVVCAKDHAADIVCSQIVRFNEKREWPGSVYKEDIVCLNDKKSIMQAYFEDEVLIGTYYAKLIKSEIIKDYPFVQDGLIGEDITAALYMFGRADRVVIIPDRTYYYYQTMDSISHSKYNHRHAVSLDNYIKVRNFLIDEGLVGIQRLSGYFAGFQMAVATAMSRNGRYEKDAGEVLRRDLRDHWKYIREDDKTQLYMKFCIMLYMVSPHLFIFLYRILYLLTGR